MIASSSPDTSCSSSGIMRHKSCTAAIGVTQKSPVDQRRPILHRLVDESYCAIINPPSLAAQPSSLFYSVPSVQASVPCHLVLLAHATHQIVPRVKGGPV